MSPHEIELYACAAAVVTAGLRALVLVGPADGGAGGRAVSGGVQPGEVLAAVRAASARRPRPWVALGLFAVMAVMAVVQYAAPAVVGDLMRQPGALSDGQWWRAATALLVQSSGAAQIACNLPALLVVGVVAESVLGGWRTLGVFLVSGVAAQTVSLGGWAPRGGGDSVAVCGLVGALAVVCLLRGGDFGRTFKDSPLVLLVPAAGLFLCAIRNNHGVGLVVGCLLGLVLSVRTRAGLPRPAAA
ncbi:rhomboid family intramembrane serine protease [Streptacidiphilus melanogenes]|uniref:rhomboid family intramembrane serine protease n=1 Tax=Streptacidiphilus melanogenes TaxID=411235 RepID=UPI000693FDA1|nr:rhomboid family intramembrane serine protease [Streptacidiphilus melanogenes]